MSLREVLDAHDLLAAARVGGSDVLAFWRERGVEDLAVETVKGPDGATEVVRALIPGTSGASAGGDAPTLGVLGQLGGIGARPERIGFVSDGDGALVAVATGATLATMRRRGDALAGDVVVATHVCPTAPVRPRDPVPFMNSPVDTVTVSAHLLDDSMDAVLSIDTTKGNRVCNHHGFAITPTVRQGWVLRVSEDLLEIASQVSGRAPAVLPITTQDITPYGNGCYHINSIMQPATVTEVPVVGVAITTEAVVPGCATGTTDLSVIDSAVRFCVEAASEYGRRRIGFHDEAEFERLVSRYGPMTRLSTLGHGPVEQVAQARR